MLHREFPRQASVWPEGASRRDFLKLMSASMALAGLVGLREAAAGAHRSLRAAAAMRSCWASRCSSPAPCRSARTATPVLVESHEGRPTKIEGNPEHPAGLGGSDVFMQASILDMYDPDRSQIMTYLGEIRYAGAITTSALRGPLNSQKAVQGSGLAHSERAPSVRPPWLRRWTTCKAAYPQAKWIQYEPVNRDNVRAVRSWRSGSTSRRATTWRRPTSFCRSTATSFPADSRDFCTTRAQFAVTRNPDLKEKMSRFYSVQSTPTNTSGKADHRLPVRASEVEQLARAIASGWAWAAGSGRTKPEQQKFVAALVKDLQAHKGAAVVIPGDNQPPAVHALAHAMNQALGAAGNTVIYTDPVEAKPQDADRRR